MDTIVYLGGGEHAQKLLELSDVRSLEDGSVLVTRRGRPPFKRELRFVHLDTAQAAAKFLAREAVSILVVDARATEQAPGVRDALETVLAARQDSLGLPRDHVVGIVTDDREGIEAAYHFGTQRVGTVMTSPSAEALVERLEAVLDSGKAGRIAICLAGGGIEGLFYEIGVLRALDSFLANRPVVDVDLFCGISAGAVLAAFLANGVGPDEIARGLSGGSARIQAMKRTELFDPNVRELGWRATRLAGQLLREGWKPRGALSTLTRALPSAFFAGNGLRNWLERTLTSPGMTNRFDELRRPLFVGATDQDTSEAVLFGTGELADVPVHRAVRASAALAPFYAPEQINGRYYIDGAFTRTTNMRVAVAQGATLVILIDPLVPSSSDDAGHVHARGGMYGTMQGLKGLVNGRFDKAVVAIREMYPDVAFHLFRPEGKEMRILSGSPMKYFYRREIEEVAYQSTLTKIRHVLPEMSRDFSRHGVVFRDPVDPRPAPQPPSRLQPRSIGVD